MNGMNGQMGEGARGGRRRVGNGMGKTEGYREEREGQGEEIKERRQEDKKLCYC